MGDVYNFLDYKAAKEQGISVKALIQERALMQKLLDHELMEELDDEYLIYSPKESDTWPEGYIYVLAEDIETGYHDECKHTEWHVVEEGYQVSCNNCDLNAWSAPW